MAAIYDNIGAGYDNGRQADNRIRRKIMQAIGDSARVVDIGTGTGNYSPTDRLCVGVDPSQLMLDQRTEAGRPRSVRASAECLPFASDSFDCSLGVLTAHHWPDLHAGLGEMRRTSAQQVLFIREPFRSQTDFWLLDYFPSIMEIEATKRYPTVDDLGQTLRVVDVAQVAVPADCIDGFLGCYWNRPEAFLDPTVRQCISIFSFISPSAEAEGVDRLRHDLASGRWDVEHGSLRSQAEFFVGHQIVVGANT